MTDPNVLPPNWTTIRPLPDDMHPSIQNSVMRILDEDPRTANAHVAFVAAADMPGMAQASARVALMIRQDNGWGFGAYLKKEYTGPLEGGVALVYAR